MLKKRRTKPQVSTDIKTVAIKALIGSAVGLVLFFALTALASFALWKADADSEVFKYIMLIIGAVAGFVGGFVAVRPTRKNGIAVGALSALPTYLAVILTSTLVSKSGVGVIGWVFLAVLVLFSAIGGIVAVNKRK